MTTTVGARTETRDMQFPFTLERSTENDGRTFEGYAAVFDSPTNISDQRGDYVETIARGAFAKSIRERMPTFMFNHGKSMPIGEIPIGKITAIREDARGLYVKARLVDNPTVNIIRDAIRDEAITGMSFRSKILRDAWTGNGATRSCTLKELSIVECGPVTLPAYQDTTATVRSMLEAVEQTYPELVRMEWLSRDTDTAGPTIEQLVAEAIEMGWNIGDDLSDVQIIDLFDDHALFTVQPSNPEYPGLWQVNFSKNADGTVTTAMPSRPPLAVYGTEANAASEGGTAVPDAYNALDTTDFSTSADAALEGTSADAAVRAETPASKTKQIQAIELRRLGIKV